MCGTGGDLVARPGGERGGREGGSARAQLSAACSAGELGPALVKTGSWFFSFTT